MYKPLHEHNKQDLRSNRVAREHFSTWTNCMGEGERASKEESDNAPQQRSLSPMHSSWLSTNPLATNHQHVLQSSQNKRNELWGGDKSRSRSRSRSFKDKSKSRSRSSSQLSVMLHIMHVHGASLISRDTRITASFYFFYYYYPLLCKLQKRRLYMHR